MNREKLLINLARQGSSALSAALYLIDLSLYKGADADKIINLNCKQGEFNSILLECPGLHSNLHSTISLVELIEVAYSNDSLAIHIAYSLFDKDSQYPGDEVHRQRSILPTELDLEKLQENTIFSDRNEGVIRSLVEGNDVILVGQSSSGKTVTATQTALALIKQGWTISWVDLSSPNRDVFDLILSLLRTSVGKAQRHLVVLDDIQVNPSECKKAARWLSILKKFSACPISTLSLTWDSAYNVVKETFDNNITITCFGDQLIPQISKGILVVQEEDGIDTRDYSNILQHIRQESGGDLLVAHLLLRRYQAVQHLPSSHELAELAYQDATGSKLLSNEAIKLLFHLSALAQMEIDISAKYAESFGASPSREVAALPCMRRNGEFWSVGHRTIAKLILHHLQAQKHDLVDSLPSPLRIAVDYLKGASRQQIISTLERLDVASLAHQSNDQHGTAFLARAWETFLILGNYLVKQAITDASWGNNTASAVFAGEALSQLGHSSWITTNAFLQSKWKVEPHEPPVPINGQTSERIDFDEIRKTMAELEEQQPELYTGTDLSLNTDFEQMHRTWVLGLLLGFAGTARQPNNDFIALLHSSAESIQQPDGSFYPHRVPWVTARVLIGLSSTGESIRTNHVVKSACEWLRRPVSDGPYHFGYWESGTGRWNSRLATTAMCVSALYRCGYPATDPIIHAGTQYLIRNKREWIRPGSEIDGVFALSTVLMVKQRWREVKDELQTLLAWIKSQEAWSAASTIASDSHEESCKVAQVASSLIDIIWNMVYSEIPLLLEGFSTAVLNLPLPSVTPHKYKQMEEKLNALEAIVDQQIHEREITVTQIDVPIIQKRIDDWREIKSELVQLRSRLMYFDSHLHDEATFSSLLHDVEDITSVIYKLSRN